MPVSESGFHTLAVLHFVLRADRLAVGVPGLDQVIDDARQFVCRGREFGDWLLTQPQIDGGLSRDWAPGSNAVVDPSAASSYNPVKFLVLLSQETGDSRYLKSGERAADFVWMGGQSSGQFIGGTIDNPDVLDKVAAQSRWKRIWRCLTLRRTPRGSIVPGPRRIMRKPISAFGMSPCLHADEDDKLLHWKKGVPTHGVQLIATGHTLVDAYMSFDVDSYAQLAPWTGDSHYLGNRNASASRHQEYDRGSRAHL